MDQAQDVPRFLRQCVADRAAGKIHGVEHYQRLFPGSEEAIAAAFAGLEDPLTEHGLSLAARLARDGDAGIERLGPYTIVREIGRGGQGVVYEARDGRLHRRVALKVLTGFLAVTPDVQRRFRREAEVASRLDHPGICTVYEAGVERGVAYIAMRYVEGVTLAQRLVCEGAAADRNGRVAAAVRLVEDVARALHVAHEAGIVHRDVKPRNILVTAEGLPVLLDFGLARDLAADQAALTRTGELFGTPAYMSPEQLASPAAALDRRTDVWSLGVTLYEAATGRRPFEAATTDRIYQAILTQAPRDPASSGGPLPRDLRVVIATALAKDPGHRYATALDLAEDLAAVRDRRPIRARPVGPVVRCARWCRREPVRAASIALAVLAVAGAALYVPLREKARIREEAGRLLEAAEELARAYAAVRAQVLELDEKELRTTEAAPRAQPMDGPEKRAVVAAREAERDARARAGDLASRAESAFDSARAVLDLPAIRSAQAAFLSRLYVDAEEDEDEASRIRLRPRLEALGAGATLKPAGFLTLDTDPPGAGILALRYLERPDGRLVEDREHPIDLGRTPILRSGLPAGSYVLLLDAPGKRQTRVPVLIERDREWAALPGRPVRLFTDEEIGGPEWIYVAPGWSLIGGSPGGDITMRLRSRWFDGLFMAALEVTNGEYAGFLEDERRSAGERGTGPDGNSVRARVPRKTSGALLWKQYPDGSWSPAVSEERSVEEWERIPLSGISWRDADAYARWRSNRDGRPVRLPGHFEWEHAARGADGRRFPWGNGFDWSFFCGLRSSADPFHRPGGAYAADCSPFGVRDLAGSRWEFCAIVDNGDGPMAAIRGGSAWCSLVHQFDCGGLVGDAPEAVYESNGIRLVRDL